MSAEQNLDGLMAFAAVAEAGGFTAAADRLGRTKAHISQQVGRLEAQLGVSLFTRTTRRVRLTEAGAALYRQAQPALLQLREALLAAGSAGETLSGMLRLTAPVDHAAHSVAPALAAFAARQPDLQLELRASDHTLDLVGEGIDLAIRLGQLRDSSLRALKLGEFEQLVLASPDYLARHAAIAAPEDLARHDWLTLTLLATPLTWTFSHSDGRAETVRMKSRLRVDSAGSLRALLLSGAGVSALASGSLEDDLQAGRLRRLLADWQLPRGGIYAVFPPGRHVPAAVRAFVDFYRDWLAAKS